VRLAGGGSDVGGGFPGDVGGGCLPTDTDRPSEHKRGTKHVGAAVRARMKHFG